MTRPELLTALAFGTIGIVLIGAIILLARFLRKPENRHPMAGQPERNIEQIREEASVEAPADRAIR